MFTNCDCTRRIKTHSRNHTGLAIHSDCPSEGIVCSCSYEIKWTSYINPQIIKALFGIVQAVLDCLLKRGQIYMARVCKWFRLLLEIGMDGGVDTTENLFRQVYTIMQFNVETVRFKIFGGRAPY